MRIYKNVWFPLFALVILYSALNPGYIKATGSSLRNFFITDAVTLKTASVETNGGLAVNIQDQTTRAFDIRLNQIIDDTITLAVSPTVGSYDLTLTTGHGVIIGDSIAFLEQDGIPQLLFGSVLNVAADVITMDTPVPYSFDIAETVVFTFTNDMTVDGSGTAEIFTITNFFDQAIDITRFIWHSTDATAMDDSKFSGGTALTRGFVLRKKISDTQYINYWNVKTNGEFGELAYDKTYDDKAPAGSYGVTVRLTYAGPSKHGVTIRLEPGESIEALVQDDFTGYTTGSLMAEGHFVTD